MTYEPEERMGSTKPLMIVPFKPDERDWIITSYDIRSVSGGKSKQMTLEQRMFTENIKFGILKGWRLNKANKFPIGGQPFGVRAADFRSCPDPKWHDWPDQILAWKEAHQDPVYFLIESYPEHTEIPQEVYRASIKIRRDQWGELLYDQTKESATDQEENPPLISFSPAPSTEQENSSGELSPPHRPPRWDDFFSSQKQKEDFVELFRPVMHDSMRMILEADFFHKITELSDKNANTKQASQIVFLTKRIEALETMIGDLIGEREHSK